MRLLTRLHLLLLLSVSLRQLLGLLLVSLLHLLPFLIACLALLHFLMLLLLLLLKLLPLLILLRVHLLLLLLVFPVSVRISGVGWSCARHRGQIIRVDCDTATRVFLSTGSVTASLLSRYDAAIVERCRSGSGCYRRLAVIF